MNSSKGKQHANHVLMLKALSVEIGHFSLKDVNLSINAGDVLGVIGSNGAGKTTLLKTIIGILKPTSGTVFIKKDTAISMAFDDGYIPESLSAKDIDYIFPKIFKRWDREKYRQYIDKLRIPKQTNFIDFSKGTKTKLGLAVCLSMNGDLVILDEITSGIDPLTRIEILNEIKAYQNQTGASIILVTHILDDVIQLCNRFVVLTNGSITTDFSLTPETDEAVLKSLLVAKKWGILNDRLSY